MPKSDRPRHSPKVIYSEDGGLSDEKKPVVLKKNAESRVSAVSQKKEPSRPAAGIPIGRKKNASSRVIFSADEESVKNEEKKDEIKITADTSVDSKPAAEAVVISKKYAVNKYETDISGKTEKDGVKKNGGTYVSDEKTEKKESERRTSDIDDFADVLNGIESENGKSDHSDDVSSVKNKTTVKPSDKKNSENKKHGLSPCFLLGKC